MTISNNDYLINLAGTTILALASSVSLGNTLQRASLPPESEELYDNQVGSVFLRVSTLAMGLFPLMNQTDALKNLSNSGFLLCAGIGAGLHLGIRSELSQRKREQLFSVLGQPSEKKPDPLEYDPFCFDKPSTYKIETALREMKFVNISYERMEKRTYPSYIDSVLRGAHTIASMALVATSNGKIPSIIGSIAIGGNIIDQIEQPWGERISFTATTTPTPSSSRNFPVKLEGLTRQVVQPIFTIILEAKQMSKPKFCHGRSCEKSTLILLEKHPVCTSCLKQKVSNAVQEMLSEESPIFVKRFEKISHKDPWEEEAPPYELTLQLSDAPFQYNGLPIQSLSGMGYYASGDPQTQGKTKINCELIKAYHLPKTSSSLQSLDVSP